MAIIERVARRQDIKGKPGKASQTMHRGTGQACGGHQTLTNSIYRLRQRLQSRFQKLLVPRPLVSGNMLYLHIVGCTFDLLLSLAHESPPYSLSAISMSSPFSVSSYSILSHRCACQGLRSPVQQHGGSHPSMCFSLIHCCSITCQLLNC